MTHWATGVTAGSSAENLAQTLQFLVINNNSNLFSAQPVITTNGTNATLSFTPAANATGRATVTVVLRDGGEGTTDGPKQSPPQTFFILVNPTGTAPFVGNPLYLWDRRYDTSGAMDQAHAMIMDGGGNIYVTGTSSNATSGSDYLTAKYDATGNLLWATRYNGPGNGNDVALALAVDAFGNPVVTGVSVGSGTGNDYATIKYDGDTGAQLWVVRYNGPANLEDQANAVGLDASGNVFVTGFSRSASSGDDYTTIKYDGATGTGLWTNRYNGPGNANDHAMALAVDTSGNVIVTGVSRGSVSGDDYATVKYNGSYGRRGTMALATARISPARSL